MRNIIIVILIILGCGGIIFFTFQNYKNNSNIEIIEIKPDPQYNIIGYSVENRKIEAYTFGDGPQHLLFVGGIHGGYEWNSVLLAYKFIDYFKLYPEIIPKNLSLTIIPSMNPDGIYRVTNKEDRFSLADISQDKTILFSGRFNANGIDLNRNFDCKWQPESAWKNKPVSAGTAPFSEPEAQTLKNFALKNNPVAVVFWHSQANAVYASECEEGVLPETSKLTDVYSRASGYPAIKSFDEYLVTGDAEGWLASLDIPAITVELKTHEALDWEENLAGVKALLEYYK